MIGLFSALHFSTLAYGALAALAPILILAYLQRSPLKKSVVSSVILLKLLPKRKTIKERVKLPLRFFIELLALLLLALAATTPLLSDKAPHVAVVLDNSLSMRAGVGTTRFEEAKAAALELVDNLSSSSKFSLFVSSPKLERFGEENLSRSELSSLIDSVQPSLAADSLSSSLQEIQQNPIYDRIVVVSDKEVDTVSPDISWRKVGTPTSNASIAGLRLERSPANTSEVRLTASVGFSGQQSQPGKVSIAAVAPQGDVLLRSLDVNLMPNRIVETALTLPKSSGMIYHVTLSSSADTLQEDNEGWISDRTATGNEVLVVSPSGEQFGLDSLKTISISGIRADRFGLLTEQDLGKYLFIIFVGTAPASPPRVSSMMILPPYGNPIFPILSDVSEPRISSWSDEHPLTLYLKVPLLNLQAASIFEVPPWAQSIINVERGSVLAAGESEGVKFAAVGFQLLPFEGAKTPASTVLMLNLMRWLGGGTELQQSSVTGSVKRLDGNSFWTVTSPSGAKLQYSPNKGQPHLANLAEAGIYRISGGGETETLFVNPFHSEESSTFTTSVIRLSDMAKSVAEEQELRPLWRSILTFVLAIFVLDCLLQVLLIYQRLQRGTV